MTTAALHVIRPGLHTTVQDLGRWGFQSSGVSVAGPMDPFSHRLANALVGNNREAATLEITLAGPELEFEDDRLVAVAGAQFDLIVGDMSVAGGGPFPVRSGSRLRFGARARGARAYLAVGGGIDVPMVLGSRATHAPSAMGGCEGRALSRGDRVPIGSRSLRREWRHTGQAVPPPAFLREQATVRVLAGPERDRFAPDVMEILQSAPYVVGNASDRMGFRLSGPPLDAQTGGEMISDVTPMGAVQVPAGGQPLLLMADRQTTGGYPRIATVISADIGVAGQCAPGDAIWFRVCTQAEAMAALIANERLLMAAEASFR